MVNKKSVIYFFIITSLFISSCSSSDEKKICEYNKELSACNKLTNQEERMSCLNKANEKAGSLDNIDSSKKESMLVLTGTFQNCVSSAMTKKQEQEQEQEHKKCVDDWILSIQNLFDCR